MSSKYAILLTVALSGLYGSIELSDMIMKHVANNGFGYAFYIELSTIWNVWMMMIIIAGSTLRYLEWKY